MFTTFEYRPVRVDFSAWMMAHHNIELSFHAYITVVDFDICPAENCRIDTAAMYEYAGIQLEDVAKFAAILQVAHPLPVPAHVADETYNPYVGYVNAAKREALMRMDFR